MTHFLRKNSKFLLGALAGGAILYLFARRLKASEVLNTLRAADFRLILVASLLIVGTYLLRSYRWRSFLAPIRSASVSNLFAATVIGFAGVFAFGRAGEVVRPAICSMRERIRPTATFATIMIERVYDMVAIVIFFAVNLLFFNRAAIARDQASVVRAMQWAGLVMLVVAVAGIYGLSAFGRKRTGILFWAERSCARLPRRLSRTVLNLLHHLANGISVLHDFRELSVTVVQTLLIWSSVVAATWLVVRAFGLPLPVSGSVFVMSFALVGSWVPTPAGAAGPFHTAAAAGLLVMGADQNRAASIAIVLHLISFGPATLLGLYYLVKDGLSITSLRDLGEEITLHPESTVLEEKEADAASSR